MTVADRFHRLGLTIVLIALLAYAISAGEWGIGLIAGTLGAVGWWFTAGGVKRVVPGWLTSTLIWATVAWAVLLALRGGLEISAFCRFLVAIIVVKLWDRKQAKDWSQILTLSAFLVIGSVLTSDRLGTGVLLALGVPLFVYAVILLQIYHAWQRSVSSAAAAGAEAPAPDVWTRSLGKQVRRAAMWSLLGGLVVSLAVFFIMPRDIGRGQFGRWLQTRAMSVSGFSETVQLGRPGPIYKSREIVLDVATKDRDGNNIGAEGRVFYLRGATLNEYRGSGLWGKSDSAISPDTVFRGTTRTVREARYGPIGAGAVVQEVLIRNAGTRTAMFASWQPVTIKVEQGGEIGVDRTDLTIRRDQGAPGPMRYTVTSDAGLLQTPIISGRATGITFPSDRVRAVAERVLAPAQIDADPDVRPFESDAQAARVIETYLRENFTYSLDEQPLPRGRDPIEWFLEEGKQGHCEYFASAMTAMLRSVGVNARMVTGFVAAEFNQTSGHYTVRGANAHAWVEVQISNGEWRQYDPTPPANFREFHDRPRTFSSNIFGFMDAIEYAWVDSVVGFDESSRMRLLGGRGPSVPWLDRASRSFSRRVESGGTRLLNEAMVNGLVAMGLVGGAGFMVLGFSKLRQKRARRPEWAGTGPENSPTLVQMAAFYEDLLRLWKRGGRGKSVFASPLGHARTLAHPEAAAISSRLSQRFYQVRFGKHELSDAERAEVERDLRALGELAQREGLSGEKVHAS